MIYEIKIFTEKTICGADFKNKEYIKFINLNLISSLSDLTIFQLPFSGNVSGKFSELKMNNKDLFYIKESEFIKIKEKLNL